MIKRKDILAVKVQEPLVASISRRISLPVVLFPLPDSPTRPRVSPELIEKETPSTARTTELSDLNHEPPAVEKCLTRSFTDKRGGSSVVACVA